MIVLTVCDGHSRRTNAAAPRSPSRKTQLGFALVSLTILMSSDQEYSKSADLREQSELKLALNRPPGTVLPGPGGPEYTATS